MNPIVFQMNTMITLSKERTPGESGREGRKEEGRVEGKQGGRKEIRDKGR